MSRGPFGAGLVALALVLAYAGAARADGPRRGARLAWARGASAERCVGSLGLEEDVKARLGHDPFALPRELTFEGVVVSAPSGGFRAELVVRDANGKALGTRQLASRDPDCRALGDAVAIAITVAIDPDATGVPAGAVVLEPPPAPPPPVPPPPPAPPALPRAHATLAGGVTAGLVPGIAPVVALHVGAGAGEHLEVGVAARFVPGSSAGGLAFALTSGALEACVLPWSRSRALRWCADAELGAFHVAVRSPELAPIEVGVFPWLGAATGPAVSVPLSPGGRLVLDASASAVVPVTRRQAFVRGTPDPAWEQSVVGGRVELGLGASF